ncbi:MAG: hypothetical protein AB8H03_02595 [Saprospiraceae bacterium]
MEDLQELISFVNKQTTQNVEVIGKATRQSSGKIYRLYEGIADGVFKNDEEAAKGILGTDSEDINYKKLKYRLKQRLINTVFFIDVNKPNYNDTQRAFYVSQKSVAAIDILLGRGARKIAIELAEKTLRQVLKFEYTEMCINLLKKLSRHYGVIEKNKKKFTEYTLLTEKYLEIYNAETIAEQLYTKLIFKSKNYFIISDDIIQEAIDSTVQLKKYLKKVNSNRFIMMAYMVFSNRYEIVNDNGNVLRICNEALRKIEQKESKMPINIFIFTSKKIDCLIQIKKYKEAEFEIFKALKLVPEGKISWLNMYEKYMRMCIHTEEYQKAFDIFTKITKNYGFQSAYKSTIEPWRIYEAYINFFIEINKIDRNETKETSPKKFRISKFLNEVPTYSSDKRGHNIPILIIQVLFLLQQKKYNRIIDKVEALNAYCYRHLKKDDTFRSNCFIKMLLLLPKCDFHRIAVERKSKILRKKLQSVPLEIARQSAEIEIVPYEDLWEIVIDMLDAKFHKK